MLALWKLNIYFRDHGSVPRPVQDRVVGRDARHMVAPVIKLNYNKLYKIHTL